MKKQTMAFVVILGAALVCAEAATDAEIKHRINYAYRIFDNPSFQEAEFSAAMRNCEYDTNRFERLLSEIACDSLTNARPLYAEYAISDIGCFGTTNSLPFLYGCATNAAVGGEAMVAALKIGGINSTMVERLDAYLQEVPGHEKEKTECCDGILNSSSVSEASFSDRTNLCACIVRHAHVNNRGIRTLDDGLKALDASYANSRRRLSVMRSLADMELKPRMGIFVTNTINELVAYPESALGD